MTVEVQIGSTLSAEVPEVAHLPRSRKVKDVFRSSGHLVQPESTGDKTENVHKRKRMLTAGG
jgi:hypothetical protein